MKRIKEEFLEKLSTVILLNEKEVLEVGCGEGMRSVMIAKRCKSLVAIDPDVELIKKAVLENKAQNINYSVGSASLLSFGDNRFDAIIFTLSFHHVPKNEMNKSIDEAIRVVR